VFSLPRTRFERVTCCLGGGHPTYIGDLESISGGDQAPDVHFFIYAIWLAANWCKFGVSGVGDWKNMVNWGNGPGWA